MLERTAWQVIARGREVDHEDRSLPSRGSMSTTLLLDQSKNEEW